VMALPALGLDEVLAMNAAERTEYFEEYARFFADSPLVPYAIRVGSKTLFAADTLALRVQFDNWLQPSPKPTRRSHRR
jgi:hypothetical protein